MSLLLPAHCSVNVFFQASPFVSFLPDMICILSLETSSCQDLLHASSPVLVVCAVYNYIHYICICMCLPDRPSPPPLLCCSLICLWNVVFAFLVLLWALHHFLYNLKFILKDKMGLIKTIKADLSACWHHIDEVLNGSLVSQRAGGDQILHSISCNDDLRLAEIAKWPV